MPHVTDAASRPQQRRPDDRAPPILDSSIDVARVLGLIGAGNLARVTENLVDEAEVLARAGADPGRSQPTRPSRLRRDPVPGHDPAHQHRRGGLCGRAGARIPASRSLRGGLHDAGQLYPAAYSWSGIDLVTPDPAEQARIDGTYSSELLAGIVRAASRDRLIEIAGRIRQDAAIEGLVVGSTELSPILDERSGVRMPLPDTTRLHVTAIADRMLGS